MHSDNSYLEAQRVALARFHNKRKRQCFVDDLESAAIANAIAASEYELEEENQRRSEELASKLREAEAVEADKELAMALETSEQVAEMESLAKSVLCRKLSRSEERNEGSWDCRICTYTNLPYSRGCAMCSTPAPPSVLTFCKMPELRFGLEIEIIVPDGKQDGYSLESIARDLTSLGGPKVDFMGYSHETCNHWKIVTDRSLQGPNGNHRDLSFELVSPVLRGEDADGLGSLRSIMDNVRKLGIATNASCGFHVHIDASQDTQQTVPEMGTLQGLKRVAQCFVALENAFDLLVGLSWDEPPSDHRTTNKNRYCRSNRLAFGQKSNRQRWDIISNASSLQELVQLMNPNADRYRKLNLMNIVQPHRPSTCEFRHHGGVEELLEAEAWVRLLLRFCEKCSRWDSRSSACLLYENATPRDEIQALFSLVDCEGLEQFFIVDRKLFVHRRIKNEWECPVCMKKFRNSRSLSQHSIATGHQSWRNE